MHQYKYLIPIFIATVLFAGCRQDDTLDDGTYYPVELLMGMNDYQEIDLTKALPTGYSVFSPGTTDPGRIGMFMTQTPTVGTEYTYTSMTGYYTWSTTDLKWKSNVSVKYDANPSGDNNYYAYGFMPAGGSITATIKSSNYSGGAVMTLVDVPPISSQDVCIVSGVLTGTPTASGDAYPSITEVNIQEGEYTYTASDGSNAIYLLLKHVYSKYSLKMKVDANYNAIRTIKVTDMSLSASTPALNMDVTYSHGSIPTVKTTKLSSTSTHKADVLNTETTLGTTATDLASFYCADALDNIVLTTTFDVYDKSGYKLRSNCKTTNTIKVQKLEAGKHYTITATIQPTYLYQISETDLDRPTVVL